MKVLAAQSKKVAVKKQFEGLKTLLSGELGIEPAPETRRLYKELMQIHHRMLLNSETVGFTLAFSPSEWTPR